MITSRPEELETLREGGRRLSAVLRAVVAIVRPGLATAELDRIAEREIRAAGGEPVFKGYRSRRGERPFPASLCVSINDEVVHGIPRQGRILHDGDIVGLDIGMLWPSVASTKEVGGHKGLITDMAVTVPVGNILPASKKLLRVTQEALEAGIRVLQAGMRMGDLGHAIQQPIESSGFSVVRELVGHGVGLKLHESPYVPNYGIRGEGQLIRGGMVLAIEPMATAGGAAVRLDADGWTWRTADGSLAAHFEHTVVITKTGAEILTQL